MPIPDSQAAQSALLALYAEDMYECLPPGAKSTLTPPLDPRIAADGFTVVGFISGDDALLDTQFAGLGQRLFYGFLAYLNADKTKYVAVVRGTDNAVEWLEDAEFLPMPAKPPGTPGMVENGFYSIYASMQYAPIGGTSQPAAAGIVQAVGANTVTVIGHSLGSALATYLMLDLAVASGMGAQVSGCLIASPRTGDDAFVRYVDSKVRNYKVYNYSSDIVPKLPPGFTGPIPLGYLPLPKATEFTPAQAQAIVKNSVPCNHHAVCYAAMLCYALRDWTKFSSQGPNCAQPGDMECAQCITGPTRPTPPPAAGSANV